MDSLSSYTTPKIARIKDWRLGLFQKFITLLIAVYVGGYQIMWRGNHLNMHELTGVYQVQLDHPTRNSCDAANVHCMQNFTSLSNLSYCSQSPESGPIKLPCQYWDADQLGQLTNDGVEMIPTHVKTFYQTEGCQPSSSNNWTCLGYLYDFLDTKGKIQKKRDKVIPAKEIFVADVERYTLTLDHSVHSILGQRYYAFEMAGYVLDCKHENQSDAVCVPRPIPCGQKSCKPQTLAQNRAKIESPLRFRGDRRSLSLAAARAESTKMRSSRRNALEPDMDDAELGVEDAVAFLQLQQREDLLRDSLSTSRPKKSKKRDAPSAPGRADDIESLGVVSIATGDMFSIRELLKAANVSLDQRRHGLPSWVGGTYRSSGFVLVIRVHYSNVESWLGAKVLPWKIFGPTMHYTYRITKHASHQDFMLSKVHASGSDAPKHSRTLMEFHGIRVLIEQSGSLAVWDNIQLLLILTTTLALMAVSSCITDTVASQCLPDEFRKWKYEEHTHTEEKSTPTAELRPTLGVVAA